MNLIKLKEWHSLSLHQSLIAKQHMRNWFAQDEARFAALSLEANELFLDYSRNRLTTETISLLCDLAQATHLPNKMTALFSGDKVNSSENQPALHTALRDKQETPIIINGKNIAAQIAATREKMHRLVDLIHTRSFRGMTGKPIKHIVNIGIGGSYMGAMMCTHALRDYAVTDLHFHFVTSVDPSHVEEVLEAIDPETSLFIISSKSFTTLETITNAQIILAWMKSKFGGNVLAKHFIAITSAIDKAIAFGISKDHIFPIWDWVGGRYSIWSAVGLPLMLQIGTRHFEDFLDGAYGIDQHFKEAPFTKNMPVLLALISIWYTNFFGAQSQAVIPYAYRLRYLIPYLQQVEMESNGKSINLHGEPVAYNTSPILFGGEGPLGQHAYHQLLHQGQHLVPVDFILVGQSLRSIRSHSHNILLASGLSQAEALMSGKTYEEAHLQLLAKDYPKNTAKELAFHQIIPGNRPSNILFLKRITPKSLGALIALYEHKIFVQGAIWGINSFDQWGVELGKQLIPDLLPHVQDYPQKIC